MAILKKSQTIKGGYTRVNNKIIADDTLSSTAKTVLITMMYLKDGWNVNVDVLKKYLKEGRQAISNALKELENSGYIRRYRLYEDGRIKDWVYEVTDSPCTDNPNPENLDLENQNNE